MTKESFHALMTDPKTPARLDMMLAHCADIDAQQAEDEQRRKVDVMRRQFAYRLESQDPRRV
jgi:hypothetical protein